MATYHKPGDHSADHPEANLLEQQRSERPPVRDVRLDVGSGDGGEQQRHADPVVETALDIEALADPARHARRGHDRLAESGVGRRQDHRQDQRVAAVS